MREIMMTRLWRNNTIEDVALGNGSPYIQKCMHDIQADLGFITPIDTKAQINIRMMTRLWRNNTIEDVALGNGSPYIQKCMHDIQADLGFIPQ
jgi:hypothetical protein